MMMCAGYTESTHQQCRRHQHESTSGTGDLGPLKLVLAILGIESSDAINNQQPQFKSKVLLNRPTP